MFGIARTTATVGPTADWSVSIRTPAAIDNTRVAPASRAPAAAATASGGLTARIADRHGTTSALTFTPGKLAASSARRASTSSTTPRSAAPNSPEPIIPSSSADPMLPPPISNTSTPARPAAEVGAAAPGLVM